MHCEEKVTNYVVLGVEGDSYSDTFWDMTLRRWGEQFWTFRQIAVPSR